MTVELYLGRFVHILIM